MFLTPFLVTFIATLAFLAYARRYYGDKAARPLLPPGPVGVPVLGYLPFLDVLDLGGSFSGLSRKFGDVFSLRVGTETAVVLSSYDAIKSVLGDSRFDSRPDTLMFKVFNQGNRGIASSSGETWEVQRKFTHRTLKNLSKNGRLERILAEEVADLCTLLRYTENSENCRNG